MTKTGTIGRAQQLTHFVRVPAGVPALKVDFSGPSATPGTGQARFLRWHPYGLGIDSNAVSNCYTPAKPGGGCTTGSPLTPHDSDPLAGAWEITVDARRSSDTDFAPYTHDCVDSRCDGDAESRRHRSRNESACRSRGRTRSRMASVHSPVARQARTLGSANRMTPTIADGEQQRSTSRHCGIESLRATIGRHAATPLRISTCSSTTARRGSCVPAGQAADGDSEESVTIANPAGRRMAGRRSTASQFRRHDDIQLHRCVRQCSVRLRAGDGCECAASGRRVMDRARIGDGERCAGSGPRAVRQRAQC